MIIGADVTHSGKGSNAPSVAGVVATSNSINGKFLAPARIQSCKTEVSTLDARHNVHN